MLLLTSCAEPQLKCALNANIADRFPDQPYSRPEPNSRGSTTTSILPALWELFIGLATYETGNAQVRYSMRCQNGYCNDCLMQITSVRRI